MVTLSHVTSLQLRSALQSLRVAAANDPRLTESLKIAITALEAILRGSEKAG